MDQRGTVWPSFCACATYVAARPPLAPGLLSTMIGCPRSCVSFGCTVRATMSDEPPAVNGTMIVTGRSGKSAEAAVARRSAATKAGSLILSLSMDEEPVDGAG